jgi:hypothetical protein
LLGTTLSLPANIFSMNDFWNERYAQEGYAYGTAPNAFLQFQLGSIPKGPLLFPAEGEGRNAVYAAEQGYEVHAFDLSTSGQKKAYILAEERNVTLQYAVGPLDTLGYQKASFDGLVLIYAHFPAAIRKAYHEELVSYVKEGGTVIFEAFSEAQLQYTSGGPKEVAMLFTEDSVREEFPSLHFTYLDTVVVDLDEGPYHQGKGSVVRFVGVKIAL